MYKRQEEGEEEPSRFEKFLVKVCGDKLKTYLIYFSVVVALVLGVGMFILLPTALSGLVREVFSNRTFIQFPAGFAAASSAFVDNAVFSNLFEGILRMAIFLIYLFLVSRMEEIRTVFCYHGAEHKTIFCYEAGLPLTEMCIRDRAGSALHTEGENTFDQGRFKKRGDYRPC